MLLFLDVISPIPEFFIIEDNKLLYRRKILKNESEKLSDHIFETYLKMNKDLNITDKLKKTSMTIGPGSYTSLRVGAAFLAGLNISRNLEFYPLSLEDIFMFKAKKNKIEDIGFFINSSQNQKFFCMMNNQQKVEYIKLEDNNFYIKENIKSIFYNFNELKINLKKIKQNKFYFIDEILENNQKLNFKNNTIIKPLYISNNTLLN
tara:strand:+ start:290 stop:904 length:615 start_codon:yes stop_codon:yes gene_type:complete